MGKQEGPRGGTLRAAAAFCRQWNMLPDEGTVLCAVSGGADSMCLLAWLSDLAGQYGFSVAAAHFNHGLRGESAARDEAFVKDWCEKAGIPFYAGRGDTAAAAAEHGWSVEEAGRALRYAFLEQTAAEIHALRVATAHNRGDNAETVLLNLIRGTGLTGLTGIAPVRGMFIRPLLETSREEITRYLEERRIPHVEDESNQELIYTRNRIRREVLPVLRELNPRIEETLCKTAALLRQEDDYLSEATRRVCARVRCEGGRAALRRETLTALPPALQGRVVRYMLDALDVPKKDITARHIRAALDLARSSGPTAQISLPRGITARNEYETFQLCRGEAAWERAALPPVGEAVLGPWRIECRVVRAPAEERPGRLILDHGAIDGPVTADRCPAGQRMTLPGSEGSRSLKRLFVDAGLSVEARERTPAIFVGGRLAAVPGIGVDRAFVPRPGRAQYVLDFHRK